jgi:transcriptional regulator with XRE-family HTH domain
MKKRSQESFGAFIRREREGKEIGLRKMAKKIKVSPTYLSLIERGKVPSPTEEKVRAIAKIIDWDADDLLARAGRVASDITDIIKRHPIEYSALLRMTKELTAEDITQLASTLRKICGESHEETRGRKDVSP